MFKRLKEVLISQLTQGVRPEQLALSCALAFVLATFPLIGATTIIVFIAAFLLKLNQPIMQALNYIFTPVHLLLLPIFLRAGEYIMGAPPLKFDLSAMTELFHQNWRLFVIEYGIAGLHAVIGWALIAPLVGIILYYVLKPLFVKIAHREFSP